MAHYMEYSTRVYQIYLKYLAPEDIHVYSIDEIMCDVTDYLNTYGMTAKELISKIIRDIYDTMGMTATAGIGTNLYLCCHGHSGKTCGTRSQWGQNCRTQ